MEIRENFDNPSTRNSIFIGIKRDALVGLDFDALLRDQANFAVCYRFLGDREVLSGRVSKIVKYPDGDLVIVRPNPGSGLENWTTVPLWVSHYNSCGVLTVWATNKMLRGSCC